jgi:hypothetical protein
MKNKVGCSPGENRFLRLGVKTLESIGIGRVGIGRVGCVCEVGVCV